jgi:protein-arginine kinase activator protein McsA
MSAIAKSQINRKKYSCDNCDYHTYNKYDYEKHINTNKHLSNVLAMSAITKTQKSPKKHFLCINCNREYKDNSGLWRHKKKCNSKCNGTEPTQTSFNDKDKLIDFLIKEHSDIKI